MINDIDINKIVVSNKLSFIKKDFIYFIGYKDYKKIRPLCIFMVGNGLGIPIFQTFPEIQVQKAYYFFRTWPNFDIVFPETQ